MSWTLRDAVATDLEAIMGLERMLFPDDAWPVDVMRAELAQPVGRYLVALVDGSVVAYAGLRVVGEQGDVQTIAVDPASRRLGIARGLLLELLAEAGHRGAREVFLEVRADNAGAIALYEQLGFERIAVRPGYYPGGTDAHVMRVALPPAPAGVGHSDPGLVRPSRSVDGDRDG